MEVRRSSGGALLLLGAAKEIERDIGFVGAVFSS